MLCTQPIRFQTKLIGFWLTLIFPRLSQLFFPLTVTSFPALGTSNAFSRACRRWLCFPALGTCNTFSRAFRRWSHVFPRIPLVVFLRWRTITCFSRICDWSILLFASLRLGLSHPFENFDQLNSVKRYPIPTFLEQLIILHRTKFTLTLPPLLLGVHQKVEQPLDGVCYDRRHSPGPRLLDKPSEHGQQHQDLSLDCCQ